MIAAGPVPALGDERFRMSQSLFKEEKSGFQPHRDPLRLIVLRLDLIEFSGSGYDAVSRR